MLKRIKQLGKDSIIYGLGGIAAKGISFFLLPIYTRIFTPTDYGTIEMLSVISSFLGFVLGMGMDSAQSFFFFEQKENGTIGQASIVSAILQWRLSWGVIIVVLATLFAPLLNSVFFNSKLTWDYFAISFASSLFSQIMNQSAEIFRLLYKPVKFICITLTQTLLSAGIGLFLILVIGIGIKGFFWGSLAGSIISALVGWYLVGNFLDFTRWHCNWWGRLLRFGMPLVPAGLTMYILNTSDRWFISYFVGQQSLGLYAVGAKFAMIIALCVNIFRKAWWPIAMDAMQDKDGPELFQTIGRLYIAFGAVIIIILTTVSPYIVRWFTSPEFQESYPIIGALSWYSIFYGFYLIGASGIWKTEKTYWAPILMGIAAILNIILDAILVPVYGGMGAAVATSFSFLTWNILTIHISEKLWTVNYPLSIMGFHIFLGGIVTTFILKVYSQGPAVHKVIIPVILAVMVILGTSISKRNARRLFHLINDKMR